MIRLITRAAFDPAPIDSAASGVEVSAPRSGVPGRAWWLIAGFYREGVAWRALVVTSLVLCYAGGAVMFWVHAIYLGEPGPAISPVAHWMLDSSAGVLGLTPPLFVILPFAVWLARDRARGHAPRVRPGVFALIGGGSFALVTVAGPVAHDMFVARGTWVADQATRLLGEGRSPGEVGEGVSYLTSMAYQLGVGLPTYVILTWISLWLVRGIGRALPEPREQPTT